MSAFKVSGIWRMLAVWLFGVALGGFVTAKYIATTVQNGDTINIGHVKIKGSEDSTIHIGPFEKKQNPVEEDETELTRKQKRQERRKARNE